MPGPGTGDDLPPDVSAAVSARLEALAGVAETLVASPRATVLPKAGPLPAGRRALEVLQRLRWDPAALRDEGPLGGGGMGVVRLATQVALDRKVAVKRLRPEHFNEPNVEALLAEACLAGSLEHPNIIPVHDLGLDPQGTPCLVMKRIEGVTWATLLKDPAAMALHAPGRTALEEHLRILMFVCNAAHYAHSRGIVHRDLKPDNVMVGSFGEAYVVDWGVATTAGPSTEYAGTPAYMAPEMLGGAGAALSPRTDVYLLGAVLHEILTGQPPHVGATREAMAASIIRSVPRLPESAPPELAALVRACIRRDPELRPESALAVRRALEGFLQHQGSTELAAESEERLRELEASLADPQAEAMLLFNRFAECRFGFRQALRGWAGNERARQGLRRAVRAMVRYELQRGRAHAALTLLGDLPEPDAELAGEVHRAVAAEEERGRELGRLQALERDVDPRTGNRFRMALGAGIGIVWIAAPLLGKPFVLRHPRLEALSSVPVALLTALGMVLASRHAREALARVNRQLVRTVIFGMLVQAAALPAAYAALGDPGSASVALTSFYWFLLFGVIAVAFDWRLALAAGGYLVALVAMLRWPGLRYEVMAAANVVFVVNCALIWTRRPGAPAAPRAPPAGGRAPGP
jgi:eukaryotic-like serine/threonine-protein kinase